MTEKDRECEQMNLIEHNTHKRVLNMGVTTAGSSFRAPRPGQHTAALTRTLDVLAAEPVWDEESGKGSISVSLTHTDTHTKEPFQSV